MTLFVVRHGRTKANASGLLLGRTDPELDSHGVLQAQAIADALSGATEPIVVSSPLQRCTQTATAVSASYLEDERLIELDYGEFDLQPMKDIPKPVWAEWRSNADFRPPGGETLNELQTRVNRALDEFSELASERDVVVVTHVSPIKASVAWALGVSPEIAWRCFVAQASITRIATAGAVPSLMGFNSVDHLPAP